jgi:homocysteine S-methyltransferase
LFELGLEEMSSESPVLCLDGGFSNELNKRTTFDVHQEPLWTAKAIFAEPDAVFATHLAYLEAGADIVETSTYQATLKGFREHLSLDTTAGENLLRDAVRLAKKAVTSFSTAESSKNRKAPLIAGSVGPYGAALCDGSEYTGTYMDTVTKEQLIEMHLPRLRILIEEGVDLIAFETMPSVKETIVLMELLATEFPTTQAWVSFSVLYNGDKASSLKTACGESVVEAYETLQKYPQLWGFGINCCHPSDVTALLTAFQEIRQSKNDARSNSIKLIVYPNTGQDWVPGKGWISDPNLKTVDTYVNEWINLGANVIGGCCQVGPNEIKKIRQHVDEWNSNQRK